MKIIIKRNEQSAEHTIDTKDCVYAYHIIEALRLALELDGYTKNLIDEVFGTHDDVKSCVDES